jgi:DNA primase
MGTKKFILQRFTFEKDISIIKNDSNKIVVFEGFFDAFLILNFKKIERRYSNSELNFDVKKPKIIFKSYSEILLFLDNDSAGKKTKDELLSSFSKH